MNRIKSTEKLINFRFNQPINLVETLKGVNIFLTKKFYIHEEKLDKKNDIKK